MQEENHRFVTAEPDLRLIPKDTVYARLPIVKKIAGNNSYYLVTPNSRPVVLMRKSITVTQSVYKTQTHTLSH